MPNHVDNNLTITGPDDDVRRFVSAVDRSETTPGGYFEFNGVVAMPVELIGTESPVSIRTQQEIDAMWAEWHKKKDSKCNAGPMGLHSYEQNAPYGLGITQAYSEALIAKYGADNWYSWAITNWGTKWGAYDTCDGWIVTNCSISGLTTATISYNTAWSPATAFFKNASLLYPTLVFDTVYVEQGLELVGATSVENGEINEFEYDWNSPEGIELRESMGCGPSDEDEDEELV